MTAVFVRMFYQQQMPEEFAYSLVTYCTDEDLAGSTALAEVLLLPIESSVLEIWRIYDEKLSGRAGGFYCVKNLYLIESISTILISLSTSILSLFNSRQGLMNPRADEQLMNNWKLIISNCIIGFSAVFHIIVIAVLLLILLLLLLIIIITIAVHFCYYYYYFSLLLLVQILQLLSHYYYYCCSLMLLLLLLFIIAVYYYLCPLLL